MLRRLNKKHQQTPNYSLRETGLGHLASFLMLAFWCVVIFVLVANQRSITDWWKLRSYDVPPQISELATQDAMTDYSRKIFYVNKPVVDTKLSFSKSCPNAGGEKTIVLGCYHSNQAGIFVLKVSDPRLNGVVQVTAAHEMLHAAYDRLSKAERTKIDTLLENYYQNGLTDQRIKDTIAAYRASEPNDLKNEMHSIFGTEIASLPPALEQYYSKYFANRSRVTSFAAQYQSAFTTRQTALSEQKAQLDALKTQIDNGEAELQTKQDKIDSMHQSLLTLRENDRIEEYNAGVPVYNNLVVDYNNQARAVQASIDRYNQIRLSYNALVLEHDQLVSELSGGVAQIKN